MTSSDGNTSEKGGSMQKRGKGRPPTRGVPMIKVQTWLQPAHVELARERGHGLVATGLRAIVEEYAAALLAAQTTSDQHDSPT